MKERAVTKTTQQLMVMGLDRKIFWLSQILADGCYLLVSFLVPTWIVVLAFGTPYLTGVCFGPFILLTISALFSSLTASYLCVVYSILRVDLSRAVICLVLALATLPPSASRCKLLAL